MKRTNTGVEGTLKTASHRAALGFAGTFAAAALSLGLAFGGPVLAAEGASKAADAPAATASTSGAADFTTLAEDVAAKASPAVGTVAAPVQTAEGSGLAMGSCVLIDDEGHILTNYHVIEGASSITVNFNGTDYEAELVGSDPSSDLAVLSITPDENTPTPIEAGSSSDLALGEWVMTIGAPKGESQSVSQGIVSGLSRTASYDLDTTEAIYTGLIQTDAMINEGSSGGALVNAEGQLVGITTLSATTTGDWAGMSYAIPSDYAMSVADQIIENGKVEHPFVGVRLGDVTPYNYQSTGGSSYWGAYVGEVIAGGPAEAAGLQEGDVITAIDGEDVSSTDDAMIAIRSHAIGDTVTFTVDRQGKSVDVDVTLGSDGDAAANDESGTQGEADGAADDAFGNGNASGDQGGSNGGNGGNFSFFGGDNGGNGNGSGNQGGNGNGSGGTWGWGWGGSGDNGGSWGYWSNPGYGYGDGGYGYGYGDGYGSGYGYDDGYGYGHGGHGYYGGGYGYGIPASARANA